MLTPTAVVGLSAHSRLKHFLLGRLQARELGITAPGSSEGNGFNNPKLMADVVEVQRWWSWAPA